ncbi:hypothetical protein [Anatilimnocola floriformis]|uniref:hypothetical protein n=1 Tax=Anatilimnocola floriformis TaxID=2948575 RepID=UPI0020C38693|nr:hypothetical protein [Anatilimnocola floriformis]
MHRYSPSGAVPIAGGLMTVAGGLFAAAAMAFVYAFIIRWIPFIYLNFLATLGFGMGMGIVITMLASMGKIRSPLFVRFTWLLTLLFGYYVYWGMTMWAHGAWQLGLQVFMPRAVIMFAGYLFENGSWGLKNGDPVTSWFLVAFWVVEFGVLAYFSYIMAVANIDQPFCEQCNEWTETEKGVALYHATGLEPEWDKIRLGEFQSLVQLPLLSASLSEYVRMDVNACPKCTNSNFLSIQKVKTAIDKDGDESTKESALIANMTLSGDQLAQVRLLVDQAADAAAEAAAARTLELEEAEKAQQAAADDGNGFPPIKVE